MTNQEAILILNDQRNKFMDEWIDYGGVNEAYNMAISLLKDQEAVEPYMDYDGHDVWRCGKCGATIFHIYHNQSDEDWKNYAKFCRQCGKLVKWK